MRNAQLCAMDPVLMCHFFHHRWMAMLHFLLNKKNPPLGEVEHYFWQKEFQARGAPHIHCLLWVKEAPKFGDNTDEEVLQFIENYVTCEVPTEEENEQLREKVLQFQQHKCSKYCHRKYTSKKKVYTKCRFGFPRPTKTSGEVNNLMSSVRHHVTKKSPKNTYNIKRPAESRNINDYNAVLLLLWKANIDVQFIADNAEAVARYVTAYVTKAENSVADNVWSELTANKSTREAALSYGLQMLVNRVCGSEEASGRLIGQPLFGRSINVQWMSIGPADERKRVLKSLAEITEMADRDANRTDIVKNNMMDTYYPKRCNEMEDMCLFEVAEHFRFRNLKPDIEKGRFPLKDCAGCLVRHEKACLINHFKMTMDTEEKKEKTYFCLLQMFKPWRKEEEIIGEHQTYEEAFKTARDGMKNTKMELFFKMIQEQTEKERNLDEELAKNTPESSQSTLCGSQQLLGVPVIQTDADIAMEEVEGAMQAAKDAEVDLQTILRSFNSGQNNIFDEITIELEKSFEHAAGNCQCSSNHQIMYYISGEAGTGKSYLIRALRTYLQEKTKSVNCCAVAAPTGIAAFNVNGVTLHRLLMLPVEQEQRLEYNRLNPDAAQSIARLMRQVKLLIIDEISMVSNLMLAFVHLRLQEVLRSAKTAPFGGMHIIVFGDLLQLTPVKGQPVFRTLSSKDAHNAIGSIGNVNLWAFFKYYELEENMRQAEDLEYSKMLGGIRVGVLTPTVKAALETRLLSNMFPDGCTGEQLMAKLYSEGLGTVALMPKTVQCDQFNLKMMKTENEEIVIIESNDSLDGETIPLNLDLKVQKRLTDMETKVSNTAGLDRKLKLCINSRVMLRRNLSVEMGLVNGAMGRVVSFERDRAGSVFIVKVQFDTLKKPSAICRVTARFKLFKDVYVRRAQFPLCAAYAITVHKSQGLSLDSAVVSIGKDVFKEGIVYVALSRVKKLSGLYILDFKPSEVKADTSCLAEYNRLRREYAPHMDLFQLPQQTTKRKRQDTTDNNIEDDKLPEVKRQKTKEMKKELHKELGNISGFQNTTGIDCYCNSTLQLLFQIDSLMKNIASQEEKELCGALTQLEKELVQSSGEPVSAQSTRMIVAHLSSNIMFYTLEQQDAHEFLTVLLDVLEKENVCVKDFLEVSYQWKADCHVCNNVIREKRIDSNCLMLGLPVVDIVQFNDLIVDVDRGVVCSKCRRKVNSSLSILSNNEYVLVMLGRGGDTGNKNDVKISNFVHAQVSLHGKSFRTKAFVTHEGETLRCGHYITWKRQGDHWLKCNDSIITTEARAPTNLTNVYLLLLQHTEKTLQSKTVKSIKKEEKTISTRDTEEISGFLNNSGVECYSNASLQLLFEVESLLLLIKKQAEKQLCSALSELHKTGLANNDKVIPADKVRTIVASLSGKSTFSTQQQQDAQEFLLTMFEVLKSEDIPVQNTVGIAYKWESKCTSCTSVNKHPEEIGLFLMLALPDCKSINFSNIFQNIESGLLCSVCGSSTLSTLRKLKCQDSVILMFGRYREDGTKNDVKIKKFNHTQVSLAGKTYQTKAMIIHKGTTINSGHYITWKRRKSYWLQYNDGKITKENRGPHDLKEVYLLLLKKKFT